MLCWFSKRHWVSEMICMSYLKVSGSDLQNTKPSCFIAQQLLLIIDWLCDTRNSVAIPMGMMNILLHLKKLPTQYHFVSVVCHVYWTDTPFWFCMLTSVDKMFIRFIFAKDMQLHYIWYYKILIKTCSCYPCEHLFILFWAAAQLQHFITANKTWHLSCPPNSPPQECYHFTLVAHTS